MCGHAQRRLSTHVGTYCNYTLSVGGMVSVLDSGSSSLASSPGQGHCVVFLGKIVQCLSPPRNKWVPVH